MIYLNNKQSENPCQPFFENQLKFNIEDRLLADCRAYCHSIVSFPGSPWQRHANLMGYWYSKGETKISKLQRSILHYLHQWYFARGNPAYLKITNLSKKVKTSRRNTIRAITRLINRGILIRLEYWSAKYQRFRSVLLPKLYFTLKEKLVFQLEKRTHPLKETDTGGCGRYLDKVLNLFNNQECIYRYKYILYTNTILTTYSLNNHTTYDYAAPTQRPEQQDQEGYKFYQEYTTTKGINDMQIKTDSKPKRLNLKIKGRVAHPQSIVDMVDKLRQRDFDPKCISQVAMHDLLYYVQNKIFKEYFSELDDSNNPELSQIDLTTLFDFYAFNPNKFKLAYDKKLFKMLMQLVIDEKNFSNFNLIKAAKRIIGYWSGCARKPKDKSRTYRGHEANLKTKIGFKIYIAFLYHIYYEFEYDKGRPELLDFYVDAFIRGIQRLYSYAYVLNLPKTVSFDTALIDPSNSKRFLNCLIMSDDDFYAFINSSKKVYQSRPENQKSLENFKRIFVDNFYPTDHMKGNQRFEQFKPSFAKFMEILITRIEKYSVNGKRVDLCGLKLTAETEVDMPVLHYYMDWLKKDIFAETVFSFDQMFSLNNWNTFIKNFMRQERGYSNYWKIVDRN